MDTFHGQFKSTCICPLCDRISITWDVFNHISLEIPKKTEKDIPILFFRTYSNMMSSSFPTLYGVHVTEGCTALKLKYLLSELCQIPICKIGLCKINNCAITDIFEDSKHIPLSEEGMIAGYEIIPFSEKATVHTIVTHSTLKDSNGIGADTEKFGHPLLLSFKERLTCHELRTHICNQLSHIIKPEINEHFQILVRHNEKNEFSTIPDSNENFVSLMNQDCEDTIFSIVIGWSSYKMQTVIKQSKFVSYTEHSSAAGLDQSHLPVADKALTLDRCFKKFISPEVLDENNKVRIMFGH